MACSALLWATGGETQIRLRFGGHEEFGDLVRIVAGVIGEDVGRHRLLGFGAILFPEDRDERSLSDLLRTGWRRIEPRTQKDRVDGHQLLGHLVAC